jgi:hypothetical protein
MRLRPLGVLISGFVVYGAVSSAVGAKVDPVPNAIADSGSRLKARFLKGDDGTKDYQLINVMAVNGVDNHIYAEGRYLDSMRNEDCAFSTAADGAMRCLPIGAFEAGTLSTFKDSSCTQPIVGFTTPPPGCPFTPPAYVTTWDQTALCPDGTNNGLPTHYYQVGSFVGPNFNQCYYIVSQTGACAPITCPTLGGQPLAFYSIGAEVPASSFVKATNAVDP